MAIGIGLGAFGGSYLAELLARRPAEAAPDTEKLDYIIQLMQALVQQDGDILSGLGSIETILNEIKGVLAGIPGGGGGGVVIPSTVLTPWVATEPDLIFEQAIRNAGVFFTTKRVDFRNGKRLAIRAENTLNQPVILQAIGNFVDSELGATDINGPVPCLAGGNAGIGLGWDDWHPYIAVRMTVALAPIDGFLRIWSVKQE